MQALTQDELSDYDLPELVEIPVSDIEESSDFSESDEESQDEDIEEEKLQKTRDCQDLIELEKQAQCLYEKKGYAEAIPNYQKILILQKKMKVRSYYIAETYQKIANCYSGIPQLDRAIESLQESFKYYNSLTLDLKEDEIKQMNAGKVDAYFDLATAYKMKGKWARAIDYAAEGLELNKKTHSDMTDSHYTKRNNIGEEIIRACESEHKIAPPIPLSKDRSPSDKENVKRDRPPMLKTLESYSYYNAKEIKSHTLYASPRSPLLESSLFNTLDDFDLKTPKTS